MYFRENWIAFTTILTAEVRRFTRIWAQTLLPSAITAILYFMIFGSIIGSRIGEMGGHQYMKFVVPGLIMMAVITNSYTNVASSFFSRKFQRNIEEIIVSPVPNIAFLMGFVLGGTLRALLIACIITLVSLCFVDLNIAHPAITFAAVLLTALLFSLAGFVNGVYATSFDNISIVPTFILTPLTYLGGVFYSIDILPPLWRQISLFNPIVYQVSAFRFGILGSARDVNIELSFAIMISATLALFWYAMHLLKTGKGLRS